MAAPPEGAETLGRHTGPSNATSRLDAGVALLLFAAGLDTAFPVGDEALGPFLLPDAVTTDGTDVDALVPAAPVLAHVLTGPETTLPPQEDYRLDFCLDDPKHYLSGQ